MSLKLVSLLLLICGKALAVEFCYFCLDSCHDPLPVENCGEFYNDTANTKCISAQTDTSLGLLQRKQCMGSLKAASDFCARFQNIKDVTCKICQEDLCNSGPYHTLSPTLILFMMIIGFINYCAF